MSELLADDLRTRLDKLPIQRLADYMAERLDWRYGEGTVELVFSGGNLAKAYLKAGPVRLRELEELGARPPAPR